MDHRRNRTSLRGVLPVALALLLAACGCAVLVYLLPATGAVDGSTVQMMPSKKVLSAQDAIDAVGNRVITYLYEDGTSQTVRISKDPQNGSGVVIEGGTLSGDCGLAERAASSSQAGQQSEALQPGNSHEGRTAAHEATSDAFEGFRNMTGQEQLAFIESFDSNEGFAAWYQSALQAYRAAHPTIVIGEGDIIHYE